MPPILQHLLSYNSTFLVGGYITLLNTKGSTSRFFKSCFSLLFKTVCMLLKLALPILTRTRTFFSEYLIAKSKLQSRLLKFFHLMKYRLIYDNPYITKEFPYCHDFILFHIYLHFLFLDNSTCFIHNYLYRIARWEIIYRSSANRKAGINSPSTLTQSFMTSKASSSWLLH